MRSYRIALVSVLLCGLGGPAYAERYALLVGVSKYAVDGPRVHLNLEGPAQDVAALKKALIEKQGFRAANITELLDQDATRQGILDHLDQIIKSMKDGDYLLFFFGGHGTSAFDSHNQQIASYIGPNSGALVPHDLRLDSADSAAQSLIIGKRDLRPLLERIPAHAEALVLIDACYSENSVKNIPPRLKGKTRGITLGTLIAQPGNAAAASAGSVPLSADAERAYPYSNVVALTAASKDEPAAEVDSASPGGKAPTVDGKAHGVFTDSVLKALYGAGDLNHDGKITFQELHDFTRQTVQAHFPQTPQMLGPQQRDLYNSAALGEESPAAAPCVAGQAAARGKVRVFLENAAGELRDRLARDPDIELGEQNADFVVRSGPAGFDLYDQSGSMVRQFLRNEVAELMARVRAEPALRRFVEFQFPCQHFNVSLNLLPEGQSRFSSKEQMQIEGRVDSQAYLVLFNIDKSGTVSIVYPATWDERRKKSPEEKIRLGSVKPVAPFGSEYLKLLAFASEPPYELLGCKQLANRNLQCPDIEPSSKEFEALMGFVAKAGSSGAETRVRFTTYPE